VHKYLYLAGLVDGDGSIFIRKHSNRTRAGYALTLSITNTDYSLIKWLSKNFGGSVMSNKGKRREWYIWRLINRKAFEIIRKIHPYLVGKKRQAEIAMEFWSERIDLRKLPKDKRDEEIERRLRLVNAIRYENTRSKDRDSICPHPKSQKSEQD